MNLTLDALVRGMLANLFQDFIFFSLFQVTSSQITESTVVSIEPWTELVTFFHESGKQADAIAALFVGL